MDLKEVTRQTPDGTEIDLHVATGSSEAGIGEVDPWRRRLTVKVRSQPRDGLANQEVCELLRAAIGVDVRLLRGANSRSKTVLVPLDRDRLLTRLGRE